MKEKKARVEDALHATRAAVEEGIVPGGGVALIFGAQKTLDGDQDRHELKSRTRASTIVRRAIESPLRRIAENAGHRRQLDGRRQGQAPEGRERLQRSDSEVYEDLIKAGVIDPTKVVRTALQNAASCRIHAPHDRGHDRRRSRSRLAAAVEAVACPTWAAWAEECPA